MEEKCFGKSEIFFNFVVKIYIEVVKKINW